MTHQMSAASLSPHKYNPNKSNLYLIPFSTCYSSVFSLSCWGNMWESRRSEWDQNNCWPEGLFRTSVLNVILAAFPSAHISVVSSFFLTLAFCAHVNMINISRYKVSYCWGKLCNLSNNMALTLFPAARHRWGSGNWLLGGHSSGSVSETGFLDGRHTRQQISRFSWRLRAATSHNTAETNTPVSKSTENTTSTFLAFTSVLKAFWHTVT